MSPPSQYQKLASTLKTVMGLGLDIRATTKGVVLEIRLGDAERLDARLRRLLSADAALRDLIQLYTRGEDE